MRSDTGTVGRVRTVIALAVAGAAALMVGLLIIVIGVALQAVTKHPEAQVIALGAAVAITGFVFGMAVLALFVLTRGGTVSGGTVSGGTASGGTASGGTASGGTASGPDGAVSGSLEPEADGEPAREATGPHRTDPYSREQPPSVQAAGPGRPSSGRPAPAQPGRSRGDQVLNPTGVYLPGGLLAMPGEPPSRPATTGPLPRMTGPQPVHQPGMTGPQPRMTGPQPVHRHGMTGPQPKAQPGMTGPQPVFRPGAPPARDPQPRDPQARDPREQQGRARRPAQAPGQPGQPPRPGPGSPRQPGGQGRPRPAQQPAASPRPQPQPPQPGQPLQPGQPPQPGQQAATPRWPGHEFAEQARSPAAPPPASPGVFVYRDTGEPDDYPEAAVGPAGAGSPAGSAASPIDENDADYWYGPPPAAGDTPVRAPVEEARGPFEPLVTSSAGSASDAWSASGQLSAADGQPANLGEGEDEDEDRTDTHAAKLEQIKDLYLTAEAIGEENVDKHFDTLLAQQRELISEYFKQSGVKQGAGNGDMQAAAPDPGGEAEPVS